MEKIKEKLNTLVKKFSSKCDYLEIRFEEIQFSSISLKDKNISNISKVTDGGFAIRAAYKGGWGFVSCQEFDVLENKIEAVIKYARLVGKSKTYLAQVSPVKTEILSNIDKDPRLVPLKDKVDILKNYNDIILGYGKGITNSSVVYSDSFIKKYFINSEGSEIYTEQMDIAIALTPIAVKDGRIESKSIAKGSSNKFGIIYSLEDEVKEACDITVKLLKAEKVKGGKYTVILNPNLAGVFVHEAFGHMSEADSIYENERLQEILKLGRRFGKKILSIYDTGLSVGSRGYVPYDDEGVKGEKTYLIREGVLVGRLHSRETAGRLGEKPTGNARALSYKFPPICRMRNTCIEKGTVKFKDLIGDIKEGIYAIDSHGGSGGEQFTFTAAYGRMIRNGKLEEIVRDVKLTGNLFVTLKNIDAIGNDFELSDAGGGCGKGQQFPLPVSFSAPSIRINNVTVGGK